MSLNVAIYNYREFNEHIGGIERISVSLTKCLMQRGINVILIAILKSKYKIEYTSPAPLYFLPDNETCSKLNIDEFRKILIEEKIEIVLNQDSHSLASHNLVHQAVQGLYVKQVAVLHFCPTMRKLLYKHPFDSNMFTLKENCIRLLKSIAYRWPFNLYTLRDVRYHYKKMYVESDRVVLLCDKYIHEYAAIAGIKGIDKLCAINNMLSFDVNADEVKEEKRILFCARIEDEKRSERTLYVWQRIFEKLPDWSLDIVGGGHKLELLMHISQKMNLKRITFHNFKNSEDFYRKSRIFLMTSDYEGWGLTLTEAMQCQCVPIAMKTFSSIADIIDDGKNGYIIPAVNCKLMAEKVLLLATNQKLCDSMAQSAFKKSKDFSPDIIADKWVNLFEGLLNT